MKYELEDRTKRFSLTLIKSIRGLSRSIDNQVIVKQLIRSGTSIGANYREANRAESTQDFLHKIAIATKEASETEYWIELLVDLGNIDKDKGCFLRKEVNELIAILVTISYRAKNKR